VAAVSEPTPGAVTSALGASPMFKDGAGGLGISG
jgi:hypothetical protein